MNDTIFLGPFSPAGFFAFFFYIHREIRNVQFETTVGILIEEAAEFLKQFNHKNKQKKAYLLLWGGCQRGCRLRHLSLFACRTLDPRFFRLFCLVH